MDYVAMVGQFSIFYNIPFWVIGLGILAILLLAAEIGFRIGLWRKWRHQETDVDLGGGGVVLTSMLALMGLILAFTYSYSSSRFEARKQAIILEANTLGTAYLRANMMPEPGQTELKNALYEYAITRLRPQNRELLTPEARAHRLEATLSAQAKIWPLTESIALAKIPPGPAEISLIAAINEVLDVHTVRLAVLNDKIPEAILWLLIHIAAASLSVAGYNAGLNGLISRWRMTMFSVVLAGVMVAIVDFDRPMSGFIRVNQFSMQGVIGDMEKDINTAR